MTTATHASLADCAQQVEAHFQRVLDELEAMRRDLVPVLGRPRATSADVRAAISDRAKAFLSGPHDVIGMGFVAARDSLADHPLYLAWWQGDDLALLAVPGDDPTTGEAFDYTRRPWYRTPAETGLPHVTGPYVDFVCTDEYVLTMTAPVIVDGVLRGVVGGDTLVEALESRLLPTLRATGATLVNDQGRAVVSADPHVPPGALVAPGGESLACRGVPMTLVVP